MKINALPLPDADAQAASHQLTQIIVDQIAAAGGWLSFARFMELALYTPGLGYYSGGAHKFGPEGDFITAPEISPLFGRALAAQVAQVMQASAPELIEVGAGTGALAADLLEALAAQQCLPERYGIIELSGELRARQAETLRARVPQWADRVHWLDALPEQFSGCVVANEVLDVMPTQIVVWRAEGIFERGVGLDAAGALVWADQPATGPVLAAAQALPLDLSDCAADPAQEVPTEYVSEICLAARAWVAEWAQRLERGALILVDYGYPQGEYYLPSRAHGTLQCYYRHRAHTEMLSWPGLNDITTFVDFTAVAQAGYDAGLDVLGYINQAGFLQNCGVLALLAACGPTESAAYLRAARAVSRLIGPHEMGELFKVLMLGKGVQGPMLGLLRGERTHTL